MKKEKHEERKNGKKKSSVRTQWLFPIQPVIPLKFRRFDSTVDMRPVKWSHFAMEVRLGY